MIPEKVVLDLEGRCSIQLSYGRNHDHTTGAAPPAQAHTLPLLSPTARWLIANTYMLAADQEG
jgi:hypothetical protein